MHSRRVAEDVVMAKKSPPEKSPVASELKHNPFASLRSATAPVGEIAPAPAPEPPRAAHSGRLVLARQTKHRGGKAVVVIRGFAQLPHWDEAVVNSLSKELKQALGCGGTVEDGLEIVLQGDRPAAVAEWLRARGFRVDGVTS
jgi:translation initiation factor 1 (eIF-1/SUI1)